MSRVRCYDLHAHTTYSDGSDIHEMTEAATEAGLAGIGFTDHCIPFQDSFGRSDRYDLHETYEQRRAEIEAIRADDDVSIEVFDAAEVSYDPGEEATIREFLEIADFEYVIGSVHFTDAYDITAPGGVADASRATKRDAIESYVDWQIELVESGLFDILGHLDLPQRSPTIRGLLTDDDHRRLADALAVADTVPELNAGRLDREYGYIHPHPDHLQVYRDAGVEFVLGTDSHTPEQVRSRTHALEEPLEDIQLEWAELPISDRTDRSD